MCLGSAWQLPQVCGRFSGYTGARGSFTSRILWTLWQFVQTATAVFGFQAVLSPLLIASEWLMRRFGQDTTWQLPIALGGLALVIWLIWANSHVVKAALDWSSAPRVALVILQTVTGQLLLFALFPPGPA